VAEVRLFLEGRHRELGATLKRRMEEASAGQEYERAAHYRDLLESMERLGERQNIITGGVEEGDYWAAHREGGRAMVQLFCMRRGRVVTRREFRLDHDESGERFYDQVLLQYYAEAETPPELFLAEPAHEPGPLAEILGERRGGRVRIRVPRRGVRRRFMETALRNARLAFEERFRSAHTHGVEVAEELRELLELERTPLRIECLDVSHHRGELPYTSVVVFEAGRPRSRDYRIYKLREARGGDDYAAVHEVVGRRFQRLLREGKPLPDLLLIDGGRGQLASARRALEELGLEDLPLASIAKREEEIFVQGQGDPLLLDRDSPALHLVQQLRDEAHRFALRHHRSARGRRTLSSALTRIRGIGEASARRLLRRFGSVAAIRRASLEELAEEVGRARAETVRRGLREAGGQGSSGPRGKR
jgi:excinuclease ABC subunit C